MSDFNANIKLKLTGTEKLDNFESKLNDLKTGSHKIKIEFDSSSVKNLNSLLKNIGGGNNKVKIGVDTSVVQKTKAEAMQLKKIYSEIQALKVQKEKLEHTPHASNRLKHVNAELERKKALLQKVKHAYAQLSSVEKQQIRNQSSDTKAAKEAIKAKSLDDKAKALERVAKAQKRISAAEANTAANNTLSWLRNNTKAAKQYGDALRRIAEEQRKTTDFARHKELRNQFREITSEAQKLGLTGKSMLGNVKSSFTGVLSALGLRDLGTVAVRQIRQMTTEIIAVNTAFVELRKVSDASDREIANYFSNASRMAKELGTAISDAVVATSDWTRLGRETSPLIW